MPSTVRVFKHVKHLKFALGRKAWEACFQIGRGPMLRVTVGRSDAVWTPRLGRSAPLVATWRRHARTRFDYQIDKTKLRSHCAIADE